MTTENVQKQTDDFLIKALEKYQTLLPKMQEGEAKELAKDGFQLVKDEIQRRSEQKKSQNQPVEKSEQLPTKQEMQKWANKEEQAQTANYAHIETSQKQPESKTYTTPNNGIKTVKAPVFVTPDELINVELEDSKGNKQVKTFSKAQVRALARKYFSNVHESWLGKDRKMGVGFKNLLAYVVAWKEFDGALPVLRDVLPDYDRYNKGGESKEASEAFKVAQELYNKIVEILNQ